MNISFVEPRFGAIEMTHYRKGHEKNGNVYTAHFKLSGEESELLGGAEKLEITFKPKNLHPLSIRAPQQKLFKVIQESIGPAAIASYFDNVLKVLESAQKTENLPNEFYMSLKKCLTKIINQNRNV